MAAKPVSTREESSEPNDQFSESIRVPPRWGGPLDETDYANLAESWISGEIADAATLRRVDDFTGREILGQKGKRDCAGVLFTYYWPGDPNPIAYRVRRDNPEQEAGKDGKPKNTRKYLAPPGREPHLCTVWHHSRSISGRANSHRTRRGGKEGAGPFETGSPREHYSPIYSDCHSRRLELAGHRGQNRWAKG